MALVQELVLFSCALLLSIVLVECQFTYTTADPYSSSSCGYKRYKFDYQLSRYYSYTAYKYCSYSCCGTYSYRYCCYDYTDYYYVSYSIYSAVSSAAIAGIVIGSLVAAGIVISIIVCIVCACRSRPSTRGTVYQPNQTTAAVTVSTVQNGGQPGFVYPVQTYAATPQPYPVQHTMGVAPPFQPGVAPPYQPMAGGVTNTAFTSGPTAGAADSKASAPPTYAEINGDGTAFSTQ